MEDSRSRRTFMLIIIAALLLHLLGLLFLLAWQHHTQEHEKKFQEFMEAVREQAAQNPESSEWAEMKARASDFGTTVLFQDEPEFSSASQNAQEQPKQEEKPQVLEKEDVLSPEKVAVVDKETTEMIQEKIEEQPKKEMADSKTSYEQKTPGMTGPGKRDATPKTTLTLKDIAKGFLHTPRDEGQYTVGMEGKKGAHPSAEQLRYERYIQKLAHCINNSDKINSKKLYGVQPDKPALYVSMTLDRNGMLKNVILNSSCGCRAIDDYYVFIIREAASSFPPVPSYIADDPFTITWKVGVYTEPDKPSFRFSIH